MTHNQINYWNLQETKRSNLAKEAETGRHNLETERVERDKLDETKRHNISSLAESNRHNVATERFNISQLNESQRHNMATEAMALKQDETNRWIAQLNARLKTADLDFQKSKEAQRINEWAHEFSEAIRKNDIQAAKTLADMGGSLLARSYLTADLAPKLKSQIIGDTTTGQILPQSPISADHATAIKELPGLILGRTTNKDDKDRQFSGGGRRLKVS